MQFYLTRLFTFISLFSLFFCQKENKKKDFFAEEIWISEAPAADLPCQITENQTVIPNGRFLTPYGKMLTVAPHPFGLAISPDGKTAVTANSGVRPFSVSIITNFDTENPKIRQIPEGYLTDKEVLGAVYMGVAIAPNNQDLYIAGGQEGKIFCMKLIENQPFAEINLNNFGTKKYDNSYAGELLLSKDGRYLFVLDQFNFRVVVMETATRKILTEYPTGYYPFGLALSPDGKNLYVANVGMFEYKIFDAYYPKDSTHQKTNFPPFAYLSEESEEGTILYDSIKVPPVGKVDSPEAVSVWKINIEKVQKGEVVAKIKTGIRIGEKLDGENPVLGGASPNSIVVSDSYIFVSNGSNDCVSVIDAKSNELISNIFLQPDTRLGNLRGLIPYGLALSPDQKRLFVAEAGINALAVIDTEKLEVLGHIPTAWFPAKVQISPNGKHILVTNAKGVGSGANGGKNYQTPPEGSYVGNIMKGTVSIMPMPSDDLLPKFTEKVIQNNFSFKKIQTFSLKNQKQIVPQANMGDPSLTPIEHVVFIIKENRTYDEIFGQKANGRGDSTLARYGKYQKIRNLQNRMIENLTVTPNHQALAERFGIADNFFSDADVSYEGHRWLTGTYPNEWLETNIPTSYGGGRIFDAKSKARGMAGIGLGLVTTPEEMNEAGSIWDHLERNKIPFYNFGMGLRLTPVETKKAFPSSYIVYSINSPVSKALFDNSSKKFPTYNNYIPDQFRAKVFMEEFSEKWLAGKEKMPKFMTLHLPNDHIDAPRPEDGYPYSESYMADNDLALGRVIDFLSKTPYWKKMAIFVLEDDAQGGRDHVDAHRSVLMVISPYAKRDFVAKKHYSFGSVIKTFWHLLQIPYLNQYDFGATDLADFFTETPNYTPYSAIPADNRIFDPKYVLDPLNPNFSWENISKSIDIDDPEEMQKQHAFFPKIIPNGGRFLDWQKIMLESPLPNAQIRFTTNGTEPTEKSELYEKPIFAKKNMEIRTKIFSRSGLQSQTSKAFFEKTKYHEPHQKAQWEAGLIYQYYEGQFDQMPDFQKLSYLKRDTAFGLNIHRKIKQRDDQFAVFFEGYLEILEEGLHTFTLISDDGAKLFIDNELVIDNTDKDGRRVGIGQIALRKGKYPFRAYYYNRYEIASFALFYQTERTAQKLIEKNQWWH